MKKPLAAVFLMIWSACGHHAWGADAPAVQSQTGKPFAVKIVPANSVPAKIPAIRWEDSNFKGEFHVVLVNLTDKAQLVFARGSSWGDGALRLRITLSSGKTSDIIYRGIYSRNVPTPYLIPKGGEMVYPIVLNRQWREKPDFTRLEDRKIKLQAVYEVVPSPESKQAGIWTGTIVSAPLTVEIDLTDYDD